MSVLEVHNITKRFPGTLALDNVSASFESGKVHALVGKNGSGKSTLMKIISGAYTADEGEIIYDGQTMKFKDPMSAAAQGIATVYQELSLVPTMSVTENILMGRMPKKGKLIDWKSAKKQVKELLKELEIDIDPDKNVEELSMWQRQMVEIAKAMSFNTKVLQFDEPTSSLASHEVEMLFQMIRRLKEKGVIITYVSHKLQELWEIADTCTVIRDGKYIGKVMMRDTSKKELIQMMFGDVEVQQRPDDLMRSDEVIMEVKHLSRKNKFKDISFQLKKGEVLGIAGMLGSGRTELLKSIFGADPLDGGEIFIEGQKIQKHTLKEMMRHGLALTPEDRKTEGLILEQTIYNNLCYANLDNIKKHGFVQEKKAAEMVKQQVERLQIKVASVQQPVNSLSGGNQQKVVVGNWLNTQPKIIMFDEPSRGIDVKAKQQIFQIMWEQSRLGIASIMVSSELEELLEVCQRILIMRDGVIQQEVYPEDVKIDDLYALCMGGEK